MRGSVQFEIHGNIGVLTFDLVGSKVNLISPDVWLDVDAQLTKAAESSLKGLILVSGKDNGFCAGADIAWLAGLSNDPSRRTTINFAHSVVLRMLSFPIPIVAAIDGIALGGGLELALACHGRVAVDRQTTLLGLPEITLGLIPGGGGTQLLPRIVGLEIGLEMMLTGKVIGAREAESCGLVDSVCSQSTLLQSAIDRVSEIRESGFKNLADIHLTDNANLLDQDKSEMPVSSSSAARGILESVKSGIDKNLKFGLSTEAEWFERLNDSNDSSARIHLFLAEHDILRNARRASKVGRPTRRLFIIGGGMMGSGIAAESTYQGMSTRVRDINELALTGVQRNAQRVIANRSRTDAPLYGQRKIHGLSSSTGFEGVHGFDVVIEAVFEDAELKQALIRDVEPLMSPDAIFASNTSAIPISHLASVALHPERVIGMHFFSPVDRMKLLEIIPHVGTAKSVLATAISLGLALGKIPIVVSDSPGFFTSRVFGRWLDEGTRLITDGATINQIDSVAKKLGFPVGPLLAQDETSLLLLQRIANDPMTANITSRRVDLIAARRAIDTLVNAGHVGRSGRRGWYLYDENGRRGEPDESVYELIEINKRDVSDSEIADRLLYSFISEALLCLEEEIIQSPSDGDIASVFGIGFPRELGGPFKFVSSVGTSTAIDTMKRLDNGTGNFVTSNSMHS